MRNADFTPTESKIVKILCEGKSNKQIAAILNCGEKNVKTHLSNIFGKTGVVSRIQLVIYCFRSGIVKLNQGMPERNAFEEDTILSRAKTLGFNYRGTY